MLCNIPYTVEMPKVSLDTQGNILTVTSYNMKTRIKSIHQTMPQTTHFPF